MSDALTTDGRLTPLRTQEEAAMDALPKALAEVERLQRHWRVKVNRWWVTSVKPNAKVKRDRITVLVQAPDADEAMNRGCAFAVNNAPMGPLYKSFEAVEAASVQLPLQL